MKRQRDSEYDDGSWSPSISKSNGVNSRKASKSLPETKKARVSHNNKVPPSAPKRNLSSFVMFANHRRGEIREQHPGMSFPDIQTKISGEWKTINEEEKAMWNEKMASDKERYRREMELYNAYGIMWVHVVSAQMRGPGGWLGFNAGGRRKKANHKQDIRPVASPPPKVTRRSRGCNQGDGRACASSQRTKIDQLEQDIKALREVLLGKANPPTGSTLKRQIPRQHSRVRYESSSPALSSPSSVSEPDSDIDTSGQRCAETPDTTDISDGENDHPRPITEISPVKYASKTLPLPTNQHINVYGTNVDYRDEVEAHRSQVLWGDAADDDDNCNSSSPPSEPSTPEMDTQWPDLEVPAFETDLQESSNDSLAFLAEEERKELAIEDIRF